MVADVIGSKSSKIDYYNNVGVMINYINKNIKYNNRYIFILLVEKSLGYGNTKTPHKTQEFWAKYIGISKNTFNTKVKELEADGHIKIIDNEICTEYGNLLPYAYSPIIPKELEQYIKINNNLKSEEI
jgi:hypothetical protein